MQPSLSDLQTADSLTDDQLNALPYGMIQLDREGTVVRFNGAEARFARVAPEDVLGTNFFHDVAPCTRVQDFHGRFLEGVRRRELHAVFPFRFDFRDGRQTDVIVSIFYSGRTDTVWIQVQRSSGTL